MRRRGLLRRIFLEGESVDAKVVRKEEEILGLPFGGGNVRYWITVRYDLDGIRTARMRVTDRIYLRAREGEPIMIRVLRRKPELWVPAMQ